MNFSATKPTDVSSYRKKKISFNAETMQAHVIYSTHTNALIKTLVFLLRSQKLVLKSWKKFWKMRMRSAFPERGESSEQKPDTKWSSARADITRRAKPPVMFSWNECQSLHSLTRPFTPKLLSRPSRSSPTRTAVTAVIKSQRCYVRANCWWGRCKNMRAGIMRGLGTAWLFLIRGTFAPNWRWAELVLTSRPRSRNRHKSARGPRGISPPFRPSFCVNWCIQSSQDYFFSP